MQQQQLFDPYASDVEADARRRRTRITPAQAEQLVLDVVNRAGGEVRGDRLLRAGLDAGLDSESVSHAVHVLQRTQRITADGNVIALVAA
jgi:predicted HD phosphohydrolase